MAIASPALALQQAVHATLAGDATLVARLGGANIYDEAPRAADAPYVHLGEATTGDFSTATENGAEIRFAVIAWSRSPGRAEVLEIAAAVIDALHDRPLSLDGHRLVNLRHVASETSRGDPVAGRRAVMRFRAVTEPITL